MTNPGNETSLPGGAKPSMRDMANAIRALSMDAVRGGQLRPSRHADGHGRRGDGAVHRVPEVRRRARPTGPTATASCCRPATARCCSIRCSICTGYPDMTHRARSSNFRQLGAKTAGHPGIRPCAGHRDDHRPARSGHRHRRRHGASPSACMQRPLRRRARRSPHLCDRRRRLPDGGHQPRGDRPRRASEARPADRALGRQRHHHRRHDVAVDLDRSVEALRGRRAGPCAASTATIRKRSTRAIAKAQAVDKPVADRLQDHHRLWRAEQAGQRRRPWRASAARRDRGRRGRSSAGRTPASRFRTTSSRPGASAGAAGQRRAAPGKPLASQPEPARAEFTEPLADAVTAALTEAVRRSSRPEHGRAKAQGRDAQVVRDGAGRRQPDAARNHRRLGRPDRTRTAITKSHGRLSPATSRAATSTTASASTAWPRR